MTLKLSVAVLLISLLAAARSHGQDDSVMISPDSERLYEQAPDDSPILDLIENRVKESSQQTALFVRTRLTRRFQLARGFSDGSYLGSSTKVYNRIVTRFADKFSAGVLASKDAGEPNLADFTSWNIAVTDVGILHRIAVGNYRIESGQGVALWRGYDLSKGAEVVSPLLRESRGVVSSLSTDEVGYFFGAAAEVHINSISAIAFFSRRRLAATLDSMGNVTSMYGSGYFRTAGEVNKRDRLLERTIGAHSSYSFGNSNQIGVTYYRSAFGLPMWLGGRRFPDDRYSTISLDYSLSVRTVNVSGEWCRSNASIGGIAILQVTDPKEYAIVASLRHYPADFVALHGLGFGDRASTSNEDGLYLGMKLQCTAQASISWYYDQFTFPGASTISEFSTGGNEMLIKIALGQNPIVSMQLRSRVSDERRDEPGSPRDKLKRQQVRLEVDYHITSRVQWRVEAERVFLERSFLTAKEKGLLLYQEIAIRTTRRFSWSARIVFFRTDSYDSRLYEYERDLAGVVSNPPLYGTGVRWYAVARIGLLEHAELSMKYSDLIRDDVRHLGAGLDELPSNHDNRMSMQLDLRW